MAEIDIFHYRKSSSILHLLDPGLKLISFFIISIIIFRSNAVSLTVLSAAAITLFLIESLQSQSLSIFVFFKTIYIFIIFLIVIVFCMWASEGEISGLYSGLIYSWKLLLLLLNSHILISTTDTTGIQFSVYKLLKPVPFISAGRIATMVSLTISFIPLIFDQYLEAKAAFDSRLGRNSKNPVKIIFSIAFPLLLNTIFRADEIASAMESRCYNDNPSIEKTSFKAPDIISAIIMVIFITGIICINYIYN